MKAKEKFKVDRLGVYKMKRDQAVAALHANMYAQQAEDELNKRKESTPLNVMLGSQINHKNVAEMMRAWDRCTLPLSPSPLTSLDAPDPRALRSQVGRWYCLDGGIQEWAASTRHRVR